jgi:hypothetical protein
MHPESELARALLSAAAVRERAHRLLAIGLKDALPHFRIDLDGLHNAADLTIEVTRNAYPSLDIPLHARWRHFVVDGSDRWAALSDGVAWKDAEARARAAFDLAIVSVLVDAGAGSGWRYCDRATGRVFGHSEGLALASLAMFAEGLFSAHPGEPLRADAARLAQLSDAALAAGFQAGPENPLSGLAARAELLRRLGRAVLAAPAMFGRKAAPRPGGLFDQLADITVGGSIEATTILSEILALLGPVWPSRITMGGIPLGDCWRHPALAGGPGDDLVPLHKLSQWLAYSLVEPLQRAGIAVTEMDGLTGLAEYRNGGLFIDTGTLILRDAAAAKRCHAADSILVVEWRALTVALLDRLAELVRQRLRRTAAELPLGIILQGGTWAAGRAIARRLRPDGTPPLKIASDASLF